MKRMIFLVLVLLISLSSQVQGGSVKPLRVRSSYAVIVGINDYKYSNNEMQDLGFCEADALEMYDTLKNYCHYPESNIFLFLDGKNDPPNVNAGVADLKSLTDIFNRLSNEQLYPNADTIIFYFSGHGGEFSYYSKDQQRNVKENLLVPVDGSNEAGSIESRNLSLQKAVIDKLATSKFNRQVLFIDACRFPVGGKELASASGWIPNLRGLTGNILEYGTGMKVLFGTKPGLFCEEYPDLGHGLFTYFLIPGLRGDAPSTEGFITFGDIDKYVSTKMAEYSDTHKSREQTPYSGGDGSTLIPVVPAPGGGGGGGGGGGSDDNQKTRQLTGISVALTGQQPGFNYQLLTTSIDIQIKGPGSSVDALIPSRIKAKLDVSGYSEGSHKVTSPIGSLEFSLDNSRFPSNLNIISVTQSSIGFTVTSSEPGYSESEFSRLVPDRNFEKAIRSEIGVSSGFVPKNKLTNIQEIIFEHQNISSIEGIQLMENLTGCSFFDNQVRDIGPLSKLKHLQQLNFNNNQIGSISPLERLTELKWIALRSNNIQDLTPFVNNSHIDSGDVIYIENNPLSQYSWQNLTWVLAGRGVQIKWAPTRM